MTADNRIMRLAKALDADTDGHGLTCYMLCRRIGVLDGTEEGKARGRMTAKVACALDRLVGIGAVSRTLIRPRMAVYHAIVPSVERAYEAFIDGRRHRISDGLSEYHWRRTTHGTKQQAA